MASMRRVRRNFRAEVLRLVSSGNGNMETLTKLADGFFGRDVGYEVLIKTFLGSEVSNAVSFLRNEGHIETVGKQWKPAGELTDDDVTIISTRRLKRLRGELKSEIRMAHNFGKVEEAVLASRMLELVNEKLPEPVEESTVA